MKQLSNETMENTHFESLYPASSRFEEISKIFAFIKEGFSCELVGVPGVGKSNLLRLLSYNRNVRIKHVGKNQKWFHFVYLDLSEIKNMSFFDMEKYVFLQLADSLRDRGLLKEHEQIHKIFNQHVDLRDDLVLFQGLKEALNSLAIEKELTVVFMFDKLESSMLFLTNRFFANLRSLRNLAKYRFSAVFSAARPLEEMLEPSVYKDFWEFFQDKIVYMKLTDKPSLDFRISYLEQISGKKIDKQSLDEVICLSGGHGKLTRSCLEALAENTESRIMNYELKGFLLKQKPVANVLREIWQALTMDEQKLTANYESGIRNQEFRNGESDNEKYLERVGLLKNNKLTIPLLTGFIKEQKTMKQLSNETIVYDETKNEIRKGETVLSDGLTALEFRLLKFLLNNPNKTIERTELINAIWKESVSTAGVTDQALDQLIFRLRKKIEDNPNNPIHIQTVKGRGVRFNP